MTNPNTTGKPAEETNVVETIQSLIVAFSLAMAVRSFVTEGFVIPTGSMAPTLMGAHVRMSSPVSGYSFPIDGAIIEGLPPAEPVRVLDPMVSIDQELASTNIGNLAANRRMGDRVLVLKYLYAFQEPKRWDVVVFKNPTDPTGDAANYIKRLVGLPDEQLVIVDGDVFTAPLDADRSKFGIERKPEHVQRAVWQEVSNSDFVPVDPSLLAKIWNRPWTGGPWTASGFDLGARGNARSWRHDGAGAASLTWRNDAMPIVDFTPYNMVLAQKAMNYQKSRYSVSDVRLSMAIEAESPEKLSMEYRLDARKRSFAFGIANGKASLRIERARESAGEVTEVLAEASAELDVPPSGAPFDVECWHVDQRLSLWVNDRKIVELDYAFASLEERLVASFNGRTVDDLVRNPRSDPQPPQLSVNFSGSPLTLHRVRVDRDLYYRPAMHDPRNQCTANGEYITGAAFGTDFNAPAQLRGDHFMMCGDNSAASRDSRLWGRPSPLVEAVFGTGHGYDAPFVVPRPLLLGKAWCVYFPAPVSPMNGLPAIMPDFGELRFIR